jgi:hypothetical protein
VVGGLVEQQQVGSRQQQAAEGHAALLAAGELGDVGVAGREAQRVHGDLDLAVEVVGALGRDLGFEAGLLLADLLVVGVGVGVLGEAGVVGLEQPATSATPSMTLPFTSLVGSRCGSCSSIPTVNPG